MKRKLLLGIVTISVLLIGALMLQAFSEPPDELRGSYIGSAACGACHTVNYPAWKQTLHSTMAQTANVSTIKGDFEQDNEYWLSDGIRGDAPVPEDRLLIRMQRDRHQFYVHIFDPSSGRMNPYRISHVLGTTYRQTYLIESEGNFFRMPLQWDVKGRRWVNLWNRQAARDETAEGPMEQLLNTNARWNLACARCHTTGYRMEDGGQWSELGIACESCHGPGGAHADLYRKSIRLRIRSEVMQALDISPDNYIVRPSKLDANGSVSVCAQCHHADTWQSTIAELVEYEPGGDLSAHFRETPLERNATLPPSNKTWPDGSPRGPGMLLRSFVETRCFRDGGATCIDCHSPHIAGEFRSRLQPSSASDAYCIGCHAEIGTAITAHTHHRETGEGSRCYGCHMPRSLEGITLVGEFDYERVRTHEIDHIPFPEASVRFGGTDQMPNACADCHAERGARWAVEWTVRWWGDRERIAREIAARPDAAPPAARTRRSIGL